VPALLLFFLDADANPVEVTATPRMVAALLRTRTRDANGVELGEWTTTTQPTLAEVQELIVSAQEQVASEIHASEIPANVVAAARQAVVLRTALLIEDSHFSEQIGSGDSPFLQLRELGDAQIEAVRARIPRALRLT
jgi:hypothetical protein